MLETEPDLVYGEGESGIRPVMLALYHGRGDLAEQIREAMDSVNIWEAAALGELVSVQDLVAEKADDKDAVATDGFTPLGLAAFFSRDEMLAWLLTQGADPNKPSQNQMGVYPINSAAANRDEDSALKLVRLLVEAGADVDAAQQSGWTPLHQAAAHGFDALVRFLLDAGADRTLQGQDGRNAANLAREGGFEALAEFLTGD